jgi:hypothetical protein
MDDQNVFDLEAEDVSQAAWESAVSESQGDQLGSCVHADSCGGGWGCSCERTCYNGG